MEPTKERIREHLFEKLTRPPVPPPTADTWGPERRKTPFCKRRRRSDAALICAHPTVLVYLPANREDAPRTHARLSAHPTVSLVRPFRGVRNGEAASDVRGDGT